MSTALDFCRRRRRWLLLVAAGYGAYRIYHLPSVSRKRRQLSRLASALLSLADAAAASAETLTLLSSDLNRFLLSDSDSLPPTLTQLSKIANSTQFTTSLSTVSQSLTSGVARGLRSASPEPNSGAELSDRILDKLASPAGSGLVSVVVGSFARNLVLAFYSTAAPPRQGSEDLALIGTICGDERCKELVSDCIQRFVGTAVEAYLERTMEINTYDELFSGLTNPKHERQVKDLLASVCNGAVETLVRTSHRVMTRSEGGPTESGGWVDQVSSTMAVPENRRFVLEMTGRVTFETVRSFLEFVMWKLSDGAKRSAHAVREDVVERGLEVVRYISARSVVIYTICITLCMNVLARTRVLMPLPLPLPAA